MGAHGDRRVKRHVDPLTLSVADAAALDRMPPESRVRAGQPPPSIHGPDVAIKSTPAGLSAEPPGYGIRINPERLRIEFAVRGWTAHDAAQHCQVSEATLSGAFKGRRVSPGTLRRIAQALTKHNPVPGAANLI
jgi:hypothetical protein